MRPFFRFIRNILLLALLAFGLWTYKNNPNVQIATQDSLATLSYRINQLLTTGTATAPKNSEIKTDTDKTENDNSADTRVWSKPEATVYVDIKNNVQLRSAAIDAMNAWNRTGAFTFQQINNKKNAQIVITTVDDSDTNAAGETATTYNPSTGHLLKANVHLNRYYLQNEWYGYSNNRIVNTAEHELGHAIGLTHTKSVSVMYPKGSIYTIQPQDIKNVRRIYHEK
ncbi:M57 family metalloprotease [Lactobacillus ultunensis]|uniref:Matrixin n=1 Tax=Lactobacillus ultunensis DSM 16047 TaxID=525365 RepID=C2EPR0_9LACO|nr:M57 family metalloprotease [Lactobacillus ultunensis]EEJ71480.1 Matrixin [Lactobacillus ultunensis DSM 16047]KRL80613.1 peptidase M10A and M12B matrixin and adamalysin [Lactobacillus ultunensis DSM 16047]QQP28280.1 matrixin family metalloprotease [Lactobacillus ultunensis]